MRTYSSLTSPEVARLLRSGAVAVLPSDTVYGLMCRAGDAQAVARLYKLKHREHKPGTIIAADIEQLVELGLKRRYLTPIAQYWPGPISVVIPYSEPDLEYLHQGLQSLAVRLPRHDGLMKVLQQTGPLLTSSANLPGQPPAGTITAAAHYFTDTVDFYVDGGNLAGNLPSTIVRVVDDAIEVLRSGTVTIT